MKKRFSILKLISIIIIILVIGCIGVCYYMLTPIGKSEDTVKFNIDYNTPTVTVVHNLKESGLIRSELFTKIYIKINKIDEINAGEFNLNKGMSLKKIFEVISETGYIKAETITMTFLPGEIVTDYIKEITDKTDYTESDVLSVLNDKEYIKTLISKYWFLTDDILNNDIYYSLEGYLAGDTYEFKKDVTVKEILEKLLDQEATILDKYKSKVSSFEYNIHQIMTLASISEKEGKSLDDRKNIVGVFKNRLDNGDKLGSDVTTYYGLKLKLYERDLTYDELEQVNAYNTRSDALAGKLPVGPICNPSKDAIDSVFNYKKNDYYYFVSDKYSKIYFSKTLDEHNAIIDKLQAEGNWLEYED